MVGPLLLLEDALHAGFWFGVLSVFICRRAGDGPADFRLMLSYPTRKLARDHKYLRSAACVRRPVLRRDPSPVRSPRVSAVPASHGLSALSHMYTSGARTLMINLVNDLECCTRSFFLLRLYSLYTLRLYTQNTVCPAARLWLCACCVSL